MPGVRFTADAAGLLAEAARYTLANREVAPAVAGVSALSPAEAFSAVCTSPSADGRGYYPGTVAAFSAPAGAWTYFGPCLLMPFNGETLALGDYGPAFPCGTTPQGDALFLFLAPCCRPGSVPGSGPGSGPGGTCPQCPGVALPGTLYATVSGMGAVDGVYPITYDAASGDWWYGGRFGTCAVAYLVFACGGAGWTIGLYTTGRTVFATTTVSCSPLSVAFGGAASDFGFDTCGGTGSGTVGVTASSGGGGGPGPACVSGNCGSAGVSATLTGTVSAKVGTFATMPSTLTLLCVNSGPDHYWLGSASVTVGGVTFTPQIASATSGGSVVPAFATPGVVSGPAGANYAVADAGGACYPYDWTFHLDDGAGNSCTIHAVG